MTGFISTSSEVVAAAVERGVVVEEEGRAASPFSSVDGLPSGGTRSEEMEGPFEASLVVVGAAEGSDFVDSGSGAEVGIHRSEQVS